MRLRRTGWVGLAAVLAVLAGGVLALAPYHQPSPPTEEGEVQVITVKLGNFYFEGPKGRSSSAEEPQVVATLENGKRYKLVFENTASIAHQVVSPLFNDQSAAEGTLGQSTVRTVAPGERLEIEITPELLTVEDGRPLTFSLSCHVGHGTESDHFKLGMHGLIQVVPQG